MRPLLYKLRVVLTLGPQKFLPGLLKALITLTQKVLLKTILYALASLVPEGVASARDASIFDGSEYRERLAWLAGSQEQPVFEKIYMKSKSRRTPAFWTSLLFFILNTPAFYVRNNN